MRKKIGLMLLAGILCLALVGCGQNETPSDGETPPVENEEDIQSPAGGDAADQTPVEEPDDGEEEATYTDNFAVDETAVTAFAQKIQNVVADQDLEGLADLIAYPIYVGFSDGGVSVESREDFVALGADRIFTEDLCTEIAEADTEGLSASMAGFSLPKSGKPNIIFGVSDGHLAVVGMNY